ncbi:STAS domain-containing protein [Micromonospora sp. HSS6-12]|uniref:STAS domain-containing protein n=2 Tax=Micromonospora thermarum TaxID=2720024 RepID=A0ABX0ZCG0_9ACTN|nr:STAS domain-containing protein [Micromonospora thermarum]
MAVDRSNPDAPLIRVTGDLAYTTAGPLRNEVDRILAELPPALVFDFADLHFIDSTGLGVIVHAWREGQTGGTVIELRTVPRFLETILDLTGVAGLLARPVTDNGPDTGDPAERPVAPA